MPAKTLPDITLLLRDLQSSDWKARGAAAQELGKTRHPDAVMPLIAALHDGSLTVRQCVVVALGQLQDERAVGPLLEAAQSGNWQIHKRALAALVKLRDKAVPYLAQLLRESDYPPLPRPVVEDGRLENADITTPNSHYRAMLVDVLGAIGTEAALEAALAVVAAPDVLVRTHVACAIAQSRSERGFEALLMLLNDPHPEVWQMAAQMLGAFNDPRAIRPLVERFGDLPPFGPETDGLLAATNALRRVGEVEGESFQQLIPALEDVRPETRIAAALSLSWARDERGIEPLRRATEDADPLVRRAAEWALRALQTLPS